MLPKIPYTPSVRKQQQMKFGGYKHTSGASDGDIYDMKNITVDEYPVLTPMKKRMVSPMVPDEAIDFTFGTDGTPYYIVPSGDKNKFYKAEREIGETENTKLCRLSNKYIIIYSPKLTVYNIEADTLLSEGIPSDTIASFKNEPMTAQTTNRTHILSAKGRTEHIELYLYNDMIVANCDIYGYRVAKAFGDAIKGFGEITLRDKNLYTEKWYYGGVTYDDEALQVKFKRDLTKPLTPNKIKEKTIKSITAVDDGIYYSLDGEAYCKYDDATFATANILDALIVFYGVEVSGEDNGNKFYVSAMNQAHNLSVETYYNNIRTALEEHGLNLVVRGYVLPVVSVERSDGTLKSFSITVNGASISGIKAFDIVVDGITLEFPEEMENVFQCNNRLWGTKGNHIYASALGDPYDWGQRKGISTDGYDFAVGSEGEFTGGIAYDSKPRFFKENSMITVYGDYPAEYYSKESQLIGVAKGCEKSLVVIGQYLYWVSEQGVMRWAGGATYNISNDFGAYISKAVCGTDGRKLYMSCLTDGQQGVFAFDTMTGLWHKEDDIKVIAMERYMRNLYGLANKFIILSGEREQKCESSMVEFADISCSDLDEKTHVRLAIKAEVEDEKQVFVYIRYDNGMWEHVNTINGTHKHSVEMHVIPRRCDHFRIRLEGNGMYRIFGIAIKYYGG